MTAVATTKFPPISTAAVSGDQVVYNGLVIGYLDQTSPGFYAVTLAAEFGDHEEVVYLKKEAVSQLVRIYRKAAEEKASADFGADCAALAADEAKADQLQVRVAACPACKGWVTQAAWPHCQNDKDSQKEFAECARAGLDISTMTLTQARQLEYCECPR